MVLAILEYVPCKSYVAMGKYEAHGVSKIKLNLQQFLGSLFRPQVSVPTNRELQVYSRQEEGNVRILVM